MVGIRSSRKAKNRKVQRDEAGMGKLCEREDTPYDFREKDVMSHYRVGYTFWETIRSIFQLHNETANILTHLVAFLGTLYLWWETVPYTPSSYFSTSSYHSPKNGNVLFSDGMRWHHGKIASPVPPTSTAFDGPNWVLNILFASAAICFFLSVVAHTFCNYSLSVRDAIWQCDYGGVQFYILSITTSITLYGRPSGFLPQREQMGMYLIATAALALLVFAIACASRLKFNENKQRDYLFREMIRTAAGAALGVVAPLCALQRVLFPHEDDPNYDHLSTFLAVHSVGGIILALHLPERFWPGKFDLCFRSHNIFHVFSAAGAYLQFAVVKADIDAFHHKISPSEVEYYMWLTSRLMLACVVFMPSWISLLNSRMFRRFLRTWFAEKEGVSPSDEPPKVDPAKIRQLASKVKGR